MRRILALAALVPSLAAAAGGVTLNINATQTNGVSGSYDLTTTVPSQGNSGAVACITSDTTYRTYYSTGTASGVVTITNGTWSATLWGVESNAACNNGFKASFYKRTGATDTLICTTSASAEWGTTLGSQTATCTGSASIVAGDRIRVTWTKTAIGTGGTSRTATQYWGTASASAVTLPSCIAGVTDTSCPYAVAADIAPAAATVTAGLTVDAPSYTYVASPVAPSSSASATVARGVLLASAATGSATVTAAMTQAQAFTAALGSASSVGASPFIAQPLAADLTGPGSVGATLSVAVPAADLLAALAGTASAGATAFVSQPLASAVTGIAAVAGALSGPQPIAADLTGPAALVAALSVSGGSTTSIASPVAPSSTASATLTHFVSSIALAADIVGQAIVSCDLDVCVLANGAIVAAATVAGALSAVHPLSAALSGAASLGADLPMAVSLAAALAGPASLSDTLSIAQPVVAAVTSSAALAAGLYVTQPIAVALSVTSSVAGTASIAHALTAPLGGAAAVAGAASLAHALGAAIGAAATFSAPLLVNPGLFADMAGAGSLAPAFGSDQPIAASITAASRVTAETVGYTIADLLQMIQKLGRSGGGTLRPPGGTLR